MWTPVHPPLREGSSARSCAALRSSVDAFWIDRLRFVLMSWSEADTLGNVRAELRFYDLGNGMLTTFYTPPVSHDAFGHYVAASDSAILRRDAARASIGTPHGT